jgi:hypothetical protein
LAFSAEDDGGPDLDASVRAAALSATFLLVDKASFEMDVDPDEFEVIEPVWIRSRAGKVPLLQITDRLINGAGYCKRLNEPDPDGRRLVERLVAELVDRKWLAEANSGKRPFPLDAFLGPEHADCDQACYVCMLRYRNQPYHGMIDWQLGLTYLEVLYRKEFMCGLDGKFSRSIGLASWPRWAETYAVVMARLYGGNARQLADTGLWTFSLSEKWMPRQTEVIVVHPLWDQVDPIGILRNALEALATETGNVPRMASTFNLARRPSWVLEQLKNGRAA